MWYLDKIILKFFTDVMYLKGIICLDEFEDIMDCCNANDLENVFEKMITDKYDIFRRGELEYEFRT